MNAADIDPVVSRPVGIVRSRFTETSGMPIQTAGAPDEVGRLEVFAEFAPGLRDIEGFDYLILVTHLHRCAHERLEVVPFLDDATHGVFATRSPARPNRLGLSIVRLTAVDGTTLHFSGNDMVDGTPVLDIKPYVPRFDVRETERVGWFGARLDQLPRTRSDGRMD
ncbi:tRNA (N6-threonylcarbamoyladenosine(37)-N6)-methyltransferase TrmO [Variovorax sp. RO1]|uniref:tRNA (N6-threonylcarbamoyladenosine(37)-N6)-methyltransferase TrmO n=1 Tax=unclassified Variovorax TaxID=663243 RepID=UPI000C716EB5|nr:MULTISPECIES: tRNA (N6-threonylcarbamoyladenosine(37)-N6)-methyltransferase TrmO [unclassified Variovorax]PLC06302.1 tRNA (N6-threonylcarbamoyladenosine(37)-N6)-methyltransferase TrmO [Variovorax sp. RO1]QOF77324.1 tRNA (N6-threonylcarbamoyladenosine(37)-N6)-methyltransferase TrmO [Variovorax sp. 38R]